MLINTISDIKKIVLEIILFFIALTILLYLLLSHGVSIDKLEFFGTKIEKLYLKLDKKLIVHLHRLKIKSDKAQTNMGQKLRYINYVPYLFQEITIDRIELDNDIATLSYEDNFFSLSSPQLFAKIAFYFKNRTLYALVKKVSLKKYDLSLSGKAKIQGKRITFEGQYRLDSIHGNLRFIKGKKKIRFYVNSNPFNIDALKRAMQPLKIHPQIKTWSYERVRAKRYKLLYVKGDIDLNRFDPKKIQALAIANDVKVHFNDNLPPVMIDKVKLAYKGDNLYFKLHRPKYLDKNLDGSLVVIHSLFHNSFINISIMTRSPFDNEIQQILRAYGIDLNLIQKKGIVDANLDIKIVFKSMKSTLDGLFYTRDALFLLASTPIQARTLTLKLKNKKLIFKDSLVAVPPFLETRINGYIDLTRSFGKLFLKPLRLHVQMKGENILQIPSIDEVVNIDLKKAQLRFVQLNTTYNFFSKTLLIEHLEDLKRYSHILQALDPIEAKAKVNLIKNRVDLFVKTSKLPFYRNHHITNCHMIMNLMEQRGKINEFALFKLKPYPSILLQNVTIDLKPILETNSTKSTPELNIDFNKVTLKFKKHKLKVNRGSLNLQKKRFHFLANVGKGKITLTKALRLKASGTNLDAATINNLLAKNIFYKGRYDFSVKSDDKGLLHGSLKIQNGYMKDLKLINNFFAFLNTIPALMSFSDPGYSSTGLPIAEGKIDFLVAKDRIIFTNINIQSHSMWIKGKGYLDLGSDKISLKLNIETLKGVSSLIKNIPIAGYILLGKDGKISTAVEVYGKASDPKYRSLLPSETITLPFHIIKRTLELPFKLFE